MPRKKVVQKVPKIAPLLGYLRAQFIKCGRANCRCRNTNGHGPYYYRVLTVRGKKRKQYVKKAELPAVQASIEARRAQKRNHQEEAAEIKAMLRENRENHHRLYAILRLGGLKI